MKISLFSCILAIGFVFISSLSLADQDETDDYCAAQNPQVCAHLHFYNGELKTTEEGKFLVHVEVPSSNIIRHVSVELVMTMQDGATHGSAPLTIQPATTHNHYLVSNAWFLMTGLWKVGIHLDLKSGHDDIEIPVDIKK
jgi:hypothetical protein